MEQVEFLCVKGRLIKLRASVKRAPLRSNFLAIFDICLPKVMGAASAYMSGENEPITGCGQDAHLMRAFPKLCPSSMYWHVDLRAFAIQSPTEGRKTRLSLFQCELQVQ